MAKVVGVKFRNTSKTYYFAPEKEDSIYTEGMGVIVETSKGKEYANVVFCTKEVEDKNITQPLKKILYKATAKDEEMMRKNKEKIPEAMRIAAEKIEKLKLPMNLVTAEYSFDGKKLTFYFSADNRVDFRELVKELASEFHVRIELMQIGIRDEAKMFGGIAPCGRACCCSSFLPDFCKVSIKMAKTQGLSLNPSKISGLCGRLMCCLAYENETYQELYPKMPKVGSTVETPEGNGTVISVNILKSEAKVKILKDREVEVYKDFDVKDLKFRRDKKAEEPEEDIPEE